MWGNMAVAEEIPGTRSRSHRKTQPQGHRGKGKKMDTLQVKLGKGWRGRFFPLHVFRRGRTWWPKYHQYISIYLSNVMGKTWMPRSDILICQYINNFMEKMHGFDLRPSWWPCRWVKVPQFPQLLGLFRWGPMWHVRSRPEGTWKMRPEMAGQLSPHPEVRPPEKKSLMFRAY